MGYSTSFVGELKFTTNLTAEQLGMVKQFLRKENPEFGLVGNLWAEREDIADRWILSIENGKAIKKKEI